MPTTSPALFAELFGSVPKPVRQVLQTVLQLQDLRDLHARARLNSQAPLSRAVLELLNVEIQVSPTEQERFPRSGPLVVVANHPFGILDGLALDALLLDVRQDMKILTNSLVASAEEIRDRCIPVDVFSPTASRANLTAVRRAKEWLRDGHGLMIFPAGEVSHWRPDQGCITDPPWSVLAARFAMQAQATVLPVHFVGSNSLVFQIAGLVHPRMRTARLPRELLNKRGSTIEVRVGTPISPSELAKQGSKQIKLHAVLAGTCDLHVIQVPVFPEEWLPVTGTMSILPFHTFQAEHLGRNFLF